MKRCPNCGGIYADDVTSCAECGTNLSRFAIAEKQKVATPNSNSKQSGVHCPKCGFMQVTAVQRKWSFWAGFATNKVDRFCMNCKQKW